MRLRRTASRPTPPPPGAGEVVLARLQHDALAANRVAHDHRAAGDARVGPLAGVGNQPARAAHGGVAVAAVGAEAAAVVAAPELAPGLALARRRGDAGRARLRAVPAAQVEVDVAALVLLEGEPAGAEVAGLRLALGQGRGKGERAMAGVDLGPDGEPGAQLERHEVVRAGH